MPIFSRRMNLLKWSTCDRSYIQPEESMKVHIISKQKFKFIIDAEIIVTQIFGLLFNNSKENGVKEYSF